MDHLETEVQHMLRMLAPPFFSAWKDEIWRKAEELEATYPDYAGMTARIKAEVKTRRWHVSAPPQSSSSSATPDELQPMDAPVETPAPTPTTPPKDSTGRRSSSSREAS
ncbi:hypothetical protein [Variovorax ginsengisoli]|uniref:Uncharacterized protein n=1 Tax=Variovorax ginsengisoli TaxID=363844 RepID=A0ABT8S1T7_9BURK|nr:hypothetical protein [Variovorax ginsengisoli]MDN8612767.1 hypothetical protein [Variovorax ginsengisoli]MDO1531937.1 hypothetical protein [Variovorax ginsengisoli]